MQMHYPLKINQESINKGLKTNGNTISKCWQSCLVLKGSTCKESGKPMLTLKSYTKRGSITTAGKTSIDSVEH